MSKLYYGYCPHCDEGLSWQQEDIKYITGNPVIVCPNCQQYVIMPAMDSNKNDFLDADQLSISFVNPNKMVYTEPEEQEEQEEEEDDEL